MFNVRRWWWHMKWWHHITPNVASRKESANVEKNDQCEEVVVAQHRHHTASKCAAYQKESANIF